MPVTHSGCSGHCRLHDVRANLPIKCSGTDAHFLETNAKSTLNTITLYLSSSFLPNDSNKRQGARKTNVIELNCPFTLTCFLAGPAAWAATKIKLKREKCVVYLPCSHKCKIFIRHSMKYLILPAASCSSQYEPEEMVKWWNDEMMKCWNEKRNKKKLECF